MILADYASLVAVCGFAPGLQHRVEAARLLGMEVVANHVETGLTSLVFTTLDDGSLDYRNPGNEFLEIAVQNARNGRVPLPLPIPGVPLPPPPPGGIVTPPYVGFSCAGDGPEVAQYFIVNRKGRFGGVQGDYPSLPRPTPGDIASLFADVTTVGGWDFTGTRADMLALIEAMDAGDDTTSNALRLEYFS